MIQPPESSSLIYLLAQIRYEVRDNRKENKEDREKIYELIEKIEKEQEQKIVNLGSRVDALEKKNLRWISIRTVS